jgi:hypothetical protein
MAPKGSGYKYWIVSPHSGTTLCVCWREIDYGRSILTRPPFDPRNRCVRRVQSRACSIHGAWLMSRQSSLREDRVTKELRGITAALGAFRNTFAKGAGTRKLSAAARAGIAAAQRKRWAKARQNSGPENSKATPIRGKRTLSAAARKRIAAAQMGEIGEGEGGEKSS